MNAFAVLSDPTRRHILDFLLSGPKSVNAVVEAIGVSQPVVSKHLGVLRNVGLVEVNPDGQKRLYSISPEPLVEVDAWLTPYRKFWANKIDALSDYLDESNPEEMET